MTTRELIAQLRKDYQRQHDSYLETWRLAASMEVGRYRNPELSARMDAAEQIVLVLDEIERSLSNGFQKQVRQEYEEQGYSTDVRVLALGVCEEAGEVAGAVLATLPEYKVTPGRDKGKVAHELHDLLTYICALANATDIDLGI